MTQTVIQKSFAPFKRYLPSWAWNPIRSIGTAVLAPVLFAHSTGFWKSSFKRMAVSKDGKPLPWYTYPSIDFLKFRNYDGKNVLEFGGGQSTLWWAERANSVVTLEGDLEWYEKIKGNMPSNVELNYVSMESKEINVDSVLQALSKKFFQKYDVIVIDGLYREEMIDIAISHLNDNGIIICDNAESYGFYDGFKNKGFMRVDFFGNAPGVVLPHATSICFRGSSFIFDSDYSIPVIAFNR